MNLYEKYKNWQLKNTAFLIISLVLLFLFSGTPFLLEIINRIGNFGYLSAFFAGIFFVSIFTVAPASVILFDLANKLNPFLIAVIAGGGAVLGDYLIFRFFQDRVFAELKTLFAGRATVGMLAKIFKTPYFSWLIPLLGAIIIASPLPDEVGLCMMGLSSIKKWQFIIVTFMLNAIGILLVVTLASAI